MEQNEDSLKEQNDDRSPSPNNNYDYRKPSIESNSSSNKSFVKNEERRVSKQDKEVRKESLNLM